VHPSHLDALLSDPRLHDREVCTDRKFVDVVKKVLEFEEASRLDSFVERIHFLAKRRVREIARLLGDVEGKSGFEKAVMECLEEDSGSWWKRLLAAKVKHT
jgi:hypothetical protein